MDAKIAEIKSKFSTALSNGNITNATYKHAIRTDMGDKVFHAMTPGSLDLVEISTMKATEWLDKSAPDFLKCIRLAEEQADEALMESEMALKQMQMAFSAARERKRAMEEEGETKENEAKEQARKKINKGGRSK